MKTYPLIRVIIQLYCLILIILIGFLVHPLKEVLWPIETIPNVNSTGLLASEDKAIAPELAAEIKLGKALFKGNCATCHNRNMKSDMTGPALAGVKERWKDYPISDLYDWIKNSVKLVDTGHPKAIEVYNKYEKSRMPAFDQLSEEDIVAILVYVESVE